MSGKTKVKVTAPTATVIGGTFKLTATGLQVAGSPSFDQWYRAVVEAKALGACVLWVLGDLLTFGEQRYGEQYSQALEAADFADETLRVAAWVAKAFPPEKRVAPVPFSFYRTVAALPQPKALELLEQADSEGWTRQVLALEVKKIKEPEPVTRVTDEPTGNGDEVDESPARVDADPAKCLEAVSQMARACRRWRAYLSALMASPYADAVKNVAGGYAVGKVEKTGGQVEQGKVGPVTFGMVEYSVQALDELMAFGGGLTAMFRRAERPEVPGEGVGGWELGSDVA
jgi:hypothetical protein